MVRNRVPFLLIVVLILPMGVLLAGAEAASPRTDTDNSHNREAAEQFAACVVGRHHSDAARLVISLSVNNATAQTIADAACATASMELAPAAFQAALADVLVKQEFPTFDATLFEGAAPLKQPVLDESAFSPRPGKSYKPEELQALERAKAALRTGIAFWHFGECVVRTNPAGAHALLMTKVASPEETRAIEAMRSTFAQCPGLVDSLDRPDYLRGTIAENFYRLARCGHDPLAAECDPNVPPR